jgi:uncharacterized membrane protein
VTDRRATMLWWLRFLAAFAIPVLYAVGVSAYGHAYPGTLRTSIADWGGSLAWVAAAVVAVRQLNAARVRLCFAASPALQLSWSPGSAPSRCISSPLVKRARTTWAGPVASPG